MTLAEFREEVRLACVAAGSQRAFALLHGISPAYVGEVLDGRRAPGPLMLEVMGCRRRVVIERVSGVGEVCDGDDGRGA